MYDTQIIVGQELVGVSGQLQLQLLPGVAESRSSVLKQVGVAEVVVDARESRIESGCLLKLSDSLQQKTGFTIRATDEHAKAAVRPEVA